MTYYSVDKILQIIKDYHRNIELLKNKRKHYASVGVSQLNEEATLPRANTLSDETANEAIRHVEDRKFIADIKTDIKYLHDRLDRITDERDAQILNMRLQGHSTSDIAIQHNCSRRNVDKRLRAIAKTIASSKI